MKLEEKKRLAREHLLRKISGSEAPSGRACPWCATPFDEGKWTLYPNHVGGLHTVQCPECGFTFQFRGMTS